MLGFSAKSSAEHTFLRIVRPHRRECLQRPGVCNFTAPEVVDLGRKPINAERRRLVKSGH